jgi:hypothetical protein
MQEVSADVGDARVLSSQPSDGFGTVSGTALGARDGLRAPLYSAEPARQRLRGMEPADLETVGGCGNSKGGKAAVDPHEAVIAACGREMTTVGMEVRGFNIEADEPAVTVPSNRCEKDPGARRQSRPLYRGLRLLDRAEKSPQPPGVVVHPDLADDRQDYCPRMPFGDPDVAPSAPADPVAQAEAVTAAALPSRRWEADTVSLEANAFAFA